MKIIFFGTPSFGVPSLKILYNSGYEIVSVITGDISSPISKTANDLKIPVLIPDKLKEPNFIEKLKNLNADLFVVVAFRMLPEVVWSIPSMGTINLHASLLPNYRGASPINHAIINGEKTTGVTTFLIDKDIDTGEILLQKEVSILDYFNAGDLYNNLSFEGASLLFDTIDNLDELIPIEQDNSLIKHTAPKLTNETCRINWNLYGEQVYNFIRGLSPTPTAWTILNGKVFKIFESTILSNYLQSKYIESKSIERIGNELYIKCIDRWILPTIVQLEGKNKMYIKDFMNGIHRDTELIIN